MEKSIVVESAEICGNVFGPYDENVKIIENEYNVRITNRDGDIKISGDENVEKAEKVIAALMNVALKGETVGEREVKYFISMVDEGNEDALRVLGGDCFCITSKGKPIKPKTLGQKKYVELISSNTVTFGIGPAGTGKTYLAVAMAVTALRNKQVNRIVLTRPAVEAGENLGFLPGDLQNKVDPYLRPLYDALFDTLGMETYQKYVEKNIIEIAPLAYMRGRTLDNSFIILDEAQNTTCEQMKMFLTRLGFQSKAVITGDITQTDLPRNKRSGLKHVIKILDGIEDIAIHYLTYKDVVRHPLVQRIIKAYEDYDRREEQDKPEPRKITYLKRSRRVEK